MPFAARPFVASGHVKSYYPACIPSEQALRLIEPKIPV